MLRWYRWLLAVAVCGVLLVPLPVRGGGGGTNVETQADELLKNPDFRVRTQAALALGASGKAAAVRPLCDALSDPKAAVRAAAAAALGMLAHGGIACLDERASREPSAAVKAVIARAIENLQSVFLPTTRFYVAIGPASLRRETLDKRTEQLVRGALISGIADRTDVAVAPTKETKAQAKKRLAARPKIRSLLIAPKVSEPTYDGDALTVRVELAVFTYPAMSFKAMIPVKLTQRGVTDRDSQNENELIRIATEHAIEKFLTNLERIR